MNTIWVLNGEQGVASCGRPRARRDNERRQVIAFDAAEDEEWQWDGLVAPSWLVPPLFAIARFYMASAETGAIRVEVGVEALGYGSDPLCLDAVSRFASNSAGGEVPPRRGHPGQLPIRLTHNDAIAPGDGVRIRFRRDADESTGADSAAGDLCLVSLEIRDSS